MAQHAFEVAVAKSIEQILQEQLGALMLRNAQLEAALAEAQEQLAAAKKPQEDHP